MDITQLAVEQAISTMWNRYGEPLSLDELADSAILSKFYFSRVFRSVTGISPGRFLSVIRLFRAKNLLLETGASVTDIAFGVGYNSLGTFTSRFARSVGTSPGRYRAMSSASAHFLHADEPPARVRPIGKVSGTVVFPGDERFRVYIGAFATPVVEGAAAACTVLDDSGVFTLDRVPCGRWYIRAAAVGMRDVDPRPWARRPALVGSGGVLELRPEDLRAVSEVRLRPTTVVDLPILLALPELDNWRLPARDPVC
jgi:AraC-like DNA-binding protein